MVPEKLFNAVEFLCNADVRKQCTVHDENPFIFPSSMNSIADSSAQDNFTKFIESCDIEKNYPLLKPENLWLTK